MNKEELILTKTDLEILKFLIEKSPKKKTDLHNYLKTKIDKYSNRANDRIRILEKYGLLKEDNKNLNKGKIIRLNNIKKSFSEELVKTLLR